MRLAVLRCVRVALVFALVCSASVVCAQTSAPASSDANLTKDQIKAFLQNARIIKESGSKKGVTHPSRLTLSDGTITHDASFQIEDEHALLKEMANGQSEINFVDSYKYNIAAYRLAELVGFDDMMPIYVERRWKDKIGSLSWWLPVKMDEADRTARKIAIPDSATDTWNHQMYKIRVFDQLVYDNDANMTNVLIGDDWKIWRVDFSRAFRLIPEPKSYLDLTHCDRQLFEKMKTLKAEELTERTKPFLTKGEIKAVMQRRDKIVDYIQKEIAEKGEANVLY